MAHGEREETEDAFQSGGSGRQVGGMSCVYFWVLSLIYPKGDVEQAVEFLGQELRGGVPAVSHLKQVTVTPWVWMRWLRLGED